MNGGLNLSELDGWWAETFTPEVGWAVGDGQERGEAPAWDAAEAEALYALLEREIVPAFYTRDEHGIPTAWVGKMRESMASLVPHFSTNRGALATRLLAWQRHLSEHRNEARFAAVMVETHEGRHQFTVEVYLGRLDADAVWVELFANAGDRGDSLRHAMVLGRRVAGSGGGYECTASVPASRPAELQAIDAYWRTPTRSRSARPYLLDSPLLRQALTLEHIKPRLARLNVIKDLLGRLHYTGKDKAADAAGSANRIRIRCLRPRQRPACKVIGDGARHFEYEGD